MSLAINVLNIDFGLYSNSKIYQMPLLTHFELYVTASELHVISNAEWVLQEPCLAQQMCKIVVLNCM